MTTHQMQTSLHGRKIGLDRHGYLAMPGVQQVATATISVAQTLALFATPIQVVAAPGAGFAIVPRLVVIHKPAGTAYGGVAAGEDLVLKYTDASGGQCSSQIETDGFLTSTGAQTRVAGMPGASGAVTTATVIPVDNAAIVLHLLVGEITTGDSPLYVRTYYDVIQMAFTRP
jgi:hypothetical protein